MRRQTQGQQIQTSTTDLMHSKLTVNADDTSRPMHWFEDVRLVMMGLKSVAAGGVVLAHTDRLDESRDQCDATADHWQL